MQDQLYYFSSAHGNILVGLTNHCLEYPKIKAPFLEGMYYMYICSFLAEHNLSLKIEPIKEVLPPRENYQSIMDLVSESNLKDCEMKLIYYCKYYLQVWWVSDLCNESRTRVKQELYKGEMNETTQSFLTNE